MLRYCLVLVFLLGACEGPHPDGIRPGRRLCVRMDGTAVYADAGGQGLVTVSPTGIVRRAARRIPAVRDAVETSGAELLVLSREGSLWRAGVRSACLLVEGIDPAGHLVVSGPVILVLEPDRVRRLLPGGLLEDVSGFSATRPE